MAFKKGMSGNPNGRKPGSRNVKSEQWEALVSSLENEQSENFTLFMRSLWNGTKADKALACDLYLKLLEFHKPKLARTDVKADVTADVNVTILG